MAALSVLVAAVALIAAGSVSRAVDRFPSGGGLEQSPPARGGEAQIRGRQGTILFPLSAGPARPRFQVGGRDYKPVTLGDLLARTLRFDSLQAVVLFNADLFATGGTRQNLYGRELVLPTRADQLLVRLAGDAFDPDNAVSVKEALASFGLFMSKFTKAEIDDLGAEAPPSGDYEVTRFTTTVQSIDAEGARVLILVATDGSGYVIRQKEADEQRRTLTLIDPTGSRGGVGGYATVRTSLEVDGKVRTQLLADGKRPLRFTYDPARPIGVREQRVAELPAERASRDVIRKFSHWRLMQDGGAPNVLAQAGGPACEDLSDRVSKIGYSQAVRFEDATEEKLRRCHAQRLFASAQRAVCLGRQRQKKTVLTFNAVDVIILGPYKYCHYVTIDPEQAPTPSGRLALHQGATRIVSDIDRAGAMTVVPAPPRSRYLLPGPGADRDDKPITRELLHLLDLPQVTAFIGQDPENGPQIVYAEDLLSARVQTFMASLRKPHSPERITSINWNFERQEPYVYLDLWELLAPGGRGGPEPIHLSKQSDSPIATDYFYVDAVADLDGDGIDELIVTRMTYEPDVWAQIAILAWVEGKPGFVVYDSLK